MPAVSIFAGIDVPVLTNLVGASGPLATTLVHLFTNDIQPVKGSVLADFVEATFNGYAAEALAGAGWSAPYVNMAGNGEMSTLAQLDFIASGIAVQEMIRGYYITDSPASVLLIAERFPVAVAMGSVVGQRLGLIGRLVLSANGIDGSALQIL